jgi:hypothetical protein
MSLQGYEGALKKVGTTIEADILSLGKEVESAGNSVMQAIANQHFRSGALTYAKALLDLLASFNIPGVAGTVIKGLDKAVNVAEAADAGMSNDASIVGLAQDAKAILDATAAAGIGGSVVADIAKVADVIK